MSALDTAKTHRKYGYKVGTKSLALELTHATPLALLALLAKR